MSCRLPHKQKGRQSQLAALLKYHYDIGQLMAEEVRFELTEACTSAVFKTAALNHSATLPNTLYRNFIAHSPLKFKGYQEIRSNPPMYGRNTGGITTDPSACWKFSSTATTVRPTARPEPLSVWTNSGLAFSSSRKRIPARRA